MRRIGVIEKISSWGFAAIRVSAILLVGYLFLLSIFSTTVIDITEHSYLIGDRPLLHLFTAACTLSACVLARRCQQLQLFLRRIEEDASCFRRCRTILLLLIVGISLVLVLCIRRSPRADQKALFICASQWRAMDFSSVMSGGYLQQYQNQLGMTILLYWLSFVFGENNYLAFQLCNAFAPALIYVSLAEIAGEAVNRRSGLLVLLVGLLFLPVMMYSTFVYGTLVGLSCAVAAMRRFARFLRLGQWQDGLRGLLLGCASVWMKQNYAIFFLGIALLFFLVFLRNRRKGLLVLIFGLTLLLPIQSHLAKGTAERITGIPMNKGISSWAFIAMGMQENTGLYDGWYNSYTIQTYQDAGFDPNVQATAAKEYIEKRSSFFLEHPDEAIRFFAGKNASQWNNPNFQGDWINFNIGDGEPAYDITHAPWIAWLFSEPGAWRLSQLMNILQSLILLGAFSFLVSSEEKPPFYLGYCLILLGGFIFHFFWEAKAQYTLPYFVLLMPMCAAGWDMLAKWADLTLTLFEETKAGKTGSGRNLSNRSVAVSLMLLTAWLLIQSGISPFLNIVFKRDEDTAAYRERLLQERLAYWEEVDNRKPVSAVFSKDYHTMNLALSGHLDCEKVFFPVWSQESGQDDIVWYEAEREENERRWTATVDLSQHTKGNCYIHFDEAPKMAARKAGWITAVLPENAPDSCKAGKNERGQV